VCDGNAERDKAGQGFWNLQEVGSHVQDPMAATVKDGKDKDEDKAESEQHFEVDPSVLYGEVLLVSV
jgi:hypothetical protein